MPRRLATVDEDGVLRPHVKVPEASLPSRLSVASLNATIAELIESAGGTTGYVNLPVLNTVTIDVVPGYTYELTATGNATVTLAGDLGSQSVLVIVPGAHTVTVQGTILPAGTYVAHHLSIGWNLYAIGGGTLVDTKVPTAGTLSVSTTESSAILSVAGALDTVALHATPYRFSKDNGTTWTAWQAAASYTYTGLAASTSFTFRHEVRDAALNTKLGTAVTAPTTAVPVWSTVFTENFTLADGTSMTGRTTETGGIAYHASTANATVTGNKLHQSVHNAVSTLAVPYSTTKRVRLSGAYEIGTVASSLGTVRFGIYTASGLNNQLNFTLSYASGNAYLAFTDFAAGVWTASIPSTGPFPLTGTFEMFYNPTGKAGSLKLNGTEVATFSGDTVLNPFGFYLTAQNNFASLDTLKGEVTDV